ncbi:M56 family metallopeptidase [Pedobacter psychroterrae]|uniref:TonB family protein n=1 Tax=Pedobacter psychroterrae TaxID=2530453 RepID=A0A4R0NQR6_9SPHI|nr:M56 family metallopeptidase [Pedobacter psychroterrae]TCD03401.1 TonB family protein [Pedobacter psychroterrae]
MSWAHYIIQVNIYLVVFYGFYKLLLEKETYFVLNRIYLVSAGLFSLAIPFLRFEWFTRQEAVQPVYVGVDQFNQFIVQAGVVQQEPDRLTASNLIVVVYFCGVLFFIFRLIYQLLSVRALLRKEGAGSAFSFFSSKVVDGKLPQVKVIDKHEEIHIKQLHTLDVLFFEAIGIITWFNPIIYFYKRTVKNIHEFLADEAAANYQGDKKEYALLLLSSAFGVAPNKLTNSFFNKSLIKKRIYMLHKQRSKRTAILKYGLFLPLFAITLIMSSATIRNSEKIREVAQELPISEPLTMVKEVVTEAVKPLAQATKTVTPTLTIDVDWGDFYTHLKKSIRYAPLAQENNVQGYTQTLFTVKDGKVEEVVSADPKLGSGADEEVKRCIKSYANYGAIPDGKYSLIVAFTLSGSDVNQNDLKNKGLKPVDGYTPLASEVVIRGYKKADGSSAKVTAVSLNEIVVRKDENTSNSESKVYDFVSLDQAPTFPGGMDKFYEYLKTSLRYPAEAFANNTQGKVFLSFIVEVDGDLRDIRVDRRLGSGTDEEAVRVMATSPKWVPGMKDGKQVRVKFNIPISFTKGAPSQPGAPGQGATKSEGTVTYSTMVNQDPNKVYDFVSLQKQPEFVGGMAKFFEYLKKTVRYPAEAQKNKVSGKVFLSFVVEKDGSLTDIKVDRKLGSGLDEEAVRVIEESPRWIPGVQDGKAVRVKFNIPISFSLTQ